MRNSHKILIVDDSPDNVDILQELLEDTFSLECAFSGEECLHKAVVYKPEIILLDVMMPGIDGYETCRRLRSIPEFSRVKIIFISAKARLQEKLEGYAAGADDYIIKPFEKDCVLAKVKVYARMVDVENHLLRKSSSLEYWAEALQSPLKMIQMGGLDLSKENGITQEQKEFISRVMDKAGDLGCLLGQVSGPKKDIKIPA